MEFQKVIKWKRFSHNSYAVFCSLHKVINIGVLSVAIIANADAKSNNSHEPEESPAYYETLDDVEVTAVKEGISINGPDTIAYTIETGMIKTAPQSSVNDLLKQVPEIDVRQRGAFGVQTDISIKGATPEQTGVMLNGISISSPQTGHLSADFPLSVNAVKRIELSEGKGKNDAINIVAQPDTLTGYEASISAGLYGTLNADNIINIHKERNAHLINASISRSDGATPNSDFKTCQLFYLGQTNTSPLSTEWQIGYSRKSFGANTFYSPAYDNQWERNNRLLTSVKIEVKKPIRIAANASWRREYDHFQLIRGEAFGENFHRTDVIALSPEFRKRWGKGESALRLDYRHDAILSTNLGLPIENDSVKIFGSDRFYKNRLNRETIEILLGHHQAIGRWALDAGMRYAQSWDINSRRGFLPYLNASYRKRDIRIRLSLNNAIRIPTFTDLFYKSPTNQGNTALRNEKKTTIQLAGKHRKKGFDNELFVFHTIGKEMIDWVMYNAEDTYHSANYGLKNIGIGYHGEVRLSDISEQIPVTVGLGYQHIWQKREDGTYIFKSLYALEYLRNKLTASITAHPSRSLTIRFDTRFIDRIGNYILYENRSNTGILQAYRPYCISDLEVSQQLKQIKISATINNLFNKKYIDFGNITQPGFYGQVGLSYQLSKKGK